ncbi:MAG: hypothetical protein MR763_07600, partial [Clostridiales bacterium]|nr:hypothetical protein [Clostridiales bacterium]
CSPEKRSMFGLIPNNLSSYGNEVVAVPHPPLRGTFPPGEGISVNPQSFKQQFVFLQARCVREKNCLKAEGRKIWKN